MLLLKGYQTLVVGVSNKNSLGWAVAQAWRNAGAKVAISYEADRFESKLQELCGSDPNFNLIGPCNVQDQNQIQSMVDQVSDLYDGKLNALLHSIAYAPKESLQNSFLNTTADQFSLAHNISSFSLVSLSKAVKPIMSSGGSIVSLSFRGSTKVIPHYNVMGPAKASLEASVRQLAFEFGPENIRVNCISPGPIQTLAARGIPNLSAMIRETAEKSPLQRPVSREEIGDVATFLASGYSSCITGQTILGNVIQTFLVGLLI